PQSPQPRPKHPPQARRPPPPRASASAVRFVLRAGLCRKARRERGLSRAAGAVLALLLSIVGVAVLRATLGVHRGIRCVIDRWSPPFLDVAGEAKQVLLDTMRIEHIGHPQQVLEDHCLRDIERAILLWLGHRYRPVEEAERVHTGAARLQRRL